MIPIKRRQRGAPATMHSVGPQVHSSGQDEDYNLRETQPQLGGEPWPNARRGIVKAKDLHRNTLTSSCDPYVEVKLGNYKGRTEHIENKTNPEWNQVYAFSKDRIQSSVLEVIVKDKEILGRDECIGRVAFDLNEVPTRVPPDSPLAPQWYRLEDRRGGDIMLAVWMGTQADEAFSEAWHSDAATVYGEGVFNARSKAQMGSQVLKTKICPTRTTTPLWNEDLVFVAAEPFEEKLAITVEDRVHPSKDEVLGKMILPLTLFEKRLDHRPVHSRWFNLEKFGFGMMEADRRNELKFSSRIHLRICLEGEYQVLDGSTLYSSDQRPTTMEAAYWGYLK
ncbi:hypothetical protein VNO80_08347 [Phaseolus coccineus]|uniref:C2 domain-containing protein n=1 Tax=Phaseolus coccineus TaxID=3886 RepID=A0AAN9NQY2_PHACN